MGFLADLGRSGGARQLGNQYLAGQNSMIDTALQIQQMQQRSRALGIQEQVANARLGKIQKEEEEYNQPYNIKYSPVLMHISESLGEDSPEYKQAFESYRNAFGAGPDGLTIRGKIPQAKEILASDASFLTLSNQIVTDAKKKEYTALLKKKMTGKISPEDLQRMEQISASLSASDKQFADYQEELRKQKESGEKAKQAEEKAQLEREKFEETKRHNKASESISKAKGEKESSVVKDSEIRQQLKEMLGLSDFLERAQDPALRAKYESAAQLSSDIANNPEGYGLPKDARAGAIAQRALDIARKMTGEGVANQGRPSIESFSGK